MDKIIKTADNLINEYGYWGEHEKYGYNEWAYEVSEDYTRSGYWEWVTEKIAQEDE